MAAPGRRNENPLLERMPNDLEDDVRKFHERVKLENVVDVEMLIKGAFAAQQPTNIAGLGLTAMEKSVLQNEAKLGFWSQTKDLKVTILVTACAAITQGWQQSTINASFNDCKHYLGYPDGKGSKLLAGFINAAPWLSGSIIGTWLSDPLQKGRYGRRQALFIAAVFCVACVIGSARCTTWQEILICRLLLGIGIGAKASIAPVFAAEAAVDHLRGRLLMMWQFFDTFGIFLEFACVWIVDYNWRVLLGTASIPAIVLLCIVFICPESPRFLIRVDDYPGAFLSLRRLRGTEIQAARDLYYIHSQLQRAAVPPNSDPESRWYEKENYQAMVANTNPLQRGWGLFANPRNRRACLTAFLAMASQQLSGLNVVAFYSSSLFSDGTKLPNDNDPQLLKDNNKANWLNFGFGLANFLFTLSAYKLIDTRGRRFLLLLSLGGMFFSLVVVSSCFQIDSHSNNSQLRDVLVAAFTIGFFTFFYSIGVGPVPFTLSAEVFPLAFREVGMSFSVMVNFLGLGLLVLSVPSLTDVFGRGNEEMGKSNLLFLFTGLNALTFILVFLLVPGGTSGVSLEQIDDIFNKKTSEIVGENIAKLTKMRSSRTREE